MSAVDIEALQSWVGKTETRFDVIAAAPVAAMSATLDYPGPLAVIGEALPPCWHWLYFQDTVATSLLAADGHVRQGDFMPPVPLSRRMWAGSRLRFTSRLEVGAQARRDSTIVSIKHKRGHSGELVFVTLRHEVFQGEILAVEEEQDLVYRDNAPGGAVPVSRPAPAKAQWSREIRPDSRLLFRYSALTFNSHRIHYDRDYAKAQEGYAALVVQGPLTATLLLDLLSRELPDVVVGAFEFRAVSPLLENAPLFLQGCLTDRTISLWALDAAGSLAMEARAHVIDSV
jgi:3-methylfumaryl-CoA hydratase